MEEEEEWRERLALMMGAPWATAVQLSLPHHFSYVKLVLARAPLNSWVAQRRVEAGAEVENCGQQCPASFNFIILPSPLEGHLMQNSQNQPGRLTFHLKSGRPSCKHPIGNVLKISTNQSALNG